MKHKILSILSVTVFLLSGCQKEDLDPTIDSNYPLDGVVHISTNINALQTRSASTNYDGTTLSLSVDYGDNATYTKKNVQWTNGSGAWSPTSIDQTEIMVWKDATTSTHVYAYAPYVADQSNMTEIIFSAAEDQSAGSISSDLVGYVDADFTPSTALDNASAIPIELDHKMAQLNINLMFSNEFGANAPTVTSVSVLAQNTVTYDATTAIVPTAFGNAVAITPNSSNNVTYSVIIAPQAIAQSTKLVTITIGSGTYSYTVAPELGHTFTSNRAYTINLRIGGDKIELVDEIAVGEWNTGSEITGGEAERLSGTVSGTGGTILFNLGRVIDTDAFSWNNTGVTVTRVGTSGTTYNFEVIENTAITVNGLAWKTIIIGETTNTQEESTEDIPDAIPTAFEMINVAADRKFIGTIDNILRVDIAQGANTSISSPVNVSVEYYGRYGSPLEKEDQVGKNKGYTRKRAVVSTTDVTHSWGPLNTIANITDKWDGLANTTSLVALDSQYKAAKYCANLGDGWYLPAQNQLAGAWVSRSGLTAFEPDYYWSSTEIGSYSNSYYVNFYSGSVTTSKNKHWSRRVRCIRDL